MRLALLLSVLLLPTYARADAVGPPPSSCPRYGTPTTCHVANGHCTVATCSSTSVCTDGTVCQPTGICIRELSCGGRGGATPTDDVTGECGSGGSCPSGSTCQIRNVCSPAHPDAGFYPDGGAVPVLSQYGCCSAAGVRGGVGGLALILGVAVLALARRRRS